MKISLKRIARIAITLFGFYICYIAAAVASAFIVKNSVMDSLWMFVSSLAVALLIITVLLYITKLYSSSFRHAGVLEMMKVIFTAAAVFVANTVFVIIDPNITIEWNIVCILVFMALTLSAICLYRLMGIMQKRSQREGADEEKRILVVGAGTAGATIISELATTDKINCKAVGLIDDDVNKHGMFVSGVKVLGGTDNIERIASYTKATTIIIAIPSASAKAVKKITEACVKTNCEVKVLPGIYQLIDGEVLVSRLRNVDVQDLLGREPVRVNLDEVMGYIENKVVMVTGGGGSIGSELCRQIAGHNPEHLIILDIYENNAYEIEQELIRRHPELKLTTLIASIRDKLKMEDVFDKYRPNIVFHAAAHKHVPLMETSPAEAVKNNVFGTYNIVSCADKYGVEKFVQISTDKAVNPTNVMGATKRICEMIIQTFARRSKTCFVAVRFGNVLGSNGSVIPLFKKQIAEGGPVTVTHKDIIRYFMTIPEAVSLVLQAGAYAAGGEIFVLDMGEQVKIYDLATNLIRLMGYEPGVDMEIKITGLRPGEKLYEERLMAEEGLTRTANDRISIGKPIDFDESEFLEKLDALRECVSREGGSVKELVREIVPTYQIYENK